MAGSGFNWATAAAPSPLIVPPAAPAAPARVPGSMLMAVPGGPAPLVPAPAPAPAPEGGGIMSYLSNLFSQATGDGVLGSNGVARSLGAVAHAVAPAPAPQPSGAQVAGQIVSAPKSDPQGDEAKLVASAMRNPNITFPQIQALAGLVPLYNHPLDAKNMAGLQLYGLANDTYRKQLADANGDKTAEQNATTAYQESLRKAMGADALKDALGLIIPTGATGGGA